MEYEIKLLENGPILVKGPLRFVDSTGKEQLIERDWIALCRCGGSQNKPFCDGTHRKVNFVGAEVKFYTP